MDNAIKQLSPAALWSHFSDLNAIPRASKKEQRVVDFVKSFGESLNLDTTVDAVGNVIIRKPASKGMENHQTIVMQSHLDMVHQKNSDVNFDFDTQGIDMYVDGDWVKAKGTTLGADNGIGVATIMTLLAATDIAHPPLEALFTIDEETGMTGALSLQPGMLHGKTLLNLDTENDTELTIGCAGGVDITAQGDYKEVTPANDTDAFRIMVKGLTGGHSGADIHLGRGNANKLMNRILFELDKKLFIGISSIDGGSLRNAIPRESVAIIVVKEKDSAAAQEAVKSLTGILKEEYKTTDPDLTIEMAIAPPPESIMDKAFQEKLLRAVYACPNGIYRMSPEIEGLVQTSNNLARILVKDSSFSLQCLTRGSVDTEKYDLASAISSAFELMGTTPVYSGEYPGWQPRPDAPVVQLMSQLYKEMFHEDAHVNAVHAGLECGIIGSHYPDMQMISFGPNIFGAHSPDEKVQISSVQKFWKFLLAVLEKI